MRWCDVFGGQREQKFPRNYSKPNFGFCKKQDHLRWMCHRSLLYYQSPYFHLNLPLDLRTLGDYQILLDHQTPCTVIWNDFGIITYLDHQRPHLHFIILLDYRRLRDHQSPYFNLKLPISIYSYDHNLSDFFSFGVSFSVTVTVVTSATCSTGGM